MIKKFNDFLNEKAITPDSDFLNIFTKAFLKASESENPSEVLGSINGLDVVEFDNFLNGIEDVKERNQLKYAQVIPQIALRLLSVDPTDNRIKFIVNTFEDFNKKIRRATYGEIGSIIKELRIHIGHENIHNQQVDRMKVKQNPVIDSPEKYFKNPQEIMAMAYTCAKELLKHHDKKILIDKLKSGKVHHPLYQTYKQIGGKTQRMFTKYLYSYIEEH